MMLWSTEHRRPIGARSYRPDVGGLRGLAVLIVVGFDNKLRWLPGGFVGIDILFVITGYAICLTIYDKLIDGTFDLLKFYEQCLRRVIPVISLVILFCMCFALLALSPWEAYRLGQSVVATSLLASNFLYIFRTSYFAERALRDPLLMTWPIALGAQICIVLPLLMIFLRNRTKAHLVAYLAILSMLSLVLSVFGEFRYPIWNFYLPVTRAWEFGAGCLLAVWQSDRKTPYGISSWKADGVSVAGIVMIAAAVVLYHPGIRFPGIEAILPVLGTVFVLGSPTGRPNRLLGIRPLIAMGAISYPFYLWHWPLLSFAEILSSKPLHAQTGSILMAAALAIAIASHYWVERPFLDQGRVKAGKALFVYGVWGSLLVFMGGVLYLSKGLPSRAPDLYAIETKAALFRHYPCISSGSYLRMSERCAPTPISSKPAMAVLGGGHAEAFAEGLRDFAVKRGWELVTLTRESCPPLKGVSEWSPVDATLADSCRRFNKSALSYVAGRSDIRVVFLVGRWVGDLVPDTYQGNPMRQNADQNMASLKQGLQNEVTALEAAGKRVIIIGDVPQFTFDPVEGVRNQRMPLRRELNRLLLSDQPEDGDGSSEARSSAVKPDAELASKQIAVIKAADSKLTVIDPNDVLCNASRCYFAAGLDLYYFDAIHLSRSGAERILPLLPDLNTNAIKQ